MKILLAACCDPDRNLGVPGVMHSLADEYRALGHQVRFSFRKRPGRAEEMLFGIRLARSSDARWADLVDVHAVDAWPLCVLPRRAVVVARSHGLERVVHRNLLAARARGEARIGPLYWTYRGTLRLAFERAAVRHSNATFVLNDSDRRICLDEFGASPERIVQVPNGIPATFVHGELGTGDGIAFVGSWLRRKGADVAVRVVSEVLRRNPSQEVLLAGTGAPPEQVLADFPESLRGRLKVRDRFRREELPSLLEGRGILLFPSRSEGYPLSLAEAMGCGLAPVASAIPGVLELVADGGDGILSASEDWKSMAEAILSLQADPARLRQLRERAREKVRPTAWDVVARDQLAIYSALKARTIGPGR